MSHRAKGRVSGAAPSAAHGAPEMRIAHHRRWRLRPAVDMAFRPDLYV